jgi:Family of unknown function (DUF6629)
MCYSAEVSFTASAVIGAIGVLTCRAARNTRFMFLAVIPLMFAIQQFSEGIIWLDVGGSAIPPPLLQFSKYLYLSFAFIIWPMWLPLSLMLVEESPWRKRLMLPFFLLGAGLATYFITYLPGNTIIVEVSRQSLHYTMKAPFVMNEWFLIGIYSLATLAPCLISSTKYVIQFGILSIMGWIVAEFFYNSSFISVWCFFCAMVSTFFYMIIRVNVMAKKRKIF